MSNYTYHGMEFYKLTDSLEHLGSHSGIDVPKECPFHGEHGMFEVKGQTGVFFISEGVLRVGLRVDSGLEENRNMFRKLNEEARDRLIAELTEFRISDGFGPTLELAGFEVKKVAKEVPYIGFLRVHPITDAMLERFEWLNDPYLDGRQVNGVYRVLGTEHIFFIFLGEIQIQGDEEYHPLFDQIITQFPLPKNHCDWVDEGPCGGGFASNDDYWKWKDPTLFR